MPPSLRPAPVRMPQSPHLTHLHLHLHPDPHLHNPRKPNSIHSLSLAISGPFQKSPLFLREDGTDLDPYLHEGGPVQVLPEGLFISSRSYAETPTVIQSLAPGLVVNVAHEVVNGLLETVPQHDKSTQRATAHFRGRGGRRRQRLGSDDSGDKCLDAAVPEASAQPWLQILSPCSTPSLSPTSSGESPTTEADSSYLPDYVKVKWNHNSDMTPELLQMLDLIDEYLAEGLPVLVACNQGVSRSASLVIASVMRRRKIPLMEAYAFVKAKCKYISPNPIVPSVLELSIDPPVSSDEASRFMEVCVHV
ncbi:protein-tyrosine phosphatase-like protein [Chytriomyces sp. MP71]|nr:protein-tyrosine phosphatase-like protein [Chytriomyces sp. MP71]